MIRWHITSILFSIFCVKLYIRIKYNKTKVVVIIYIGARNCGICPIENIAYQNNSSTTNIILTRVIALQSNDVKF